MPSFQHDREFYRLQYPVEAAPRFVERGQTHRIVDIGEGGFRYAPSDGAIPLVGTAVEGVIEFRDADPLDVTGTVVRIQSGEVAVHCAAGPIPLAVVLREQRTLLKHYPFRT